MANKTRTDIKNQIYQYLPQINQTAKATLINNCIDLAVEDISNRHNFRSLRASTPDTATLAAAAYSLNLTDFTTMGGSTGYFKEVLAMFRLQTGKEDHAPVRFVDDIDFHQTYGYVDYTSAQTGAPSYYTYIATKFLFNCPADTSYTIRVWYQTYHPPFAADATSHSFDTRDNMVAFQAIVHRSLIELKNSLSSGEFPMDLQAIGQLSEGYISQLIQRDVERTLQNETFELGVLERSSRRATDENPYSWV
jgi:hypothetical protein